MFTVILCGGKGTRLHPLTYEIPKPMLPIKGKPVLEHQIEYLKKNGITEIYLAVSYLKEYIVEYFGNGENLNVNIQYLEDNCEGTAGALRGLKNKHIHSPFLVMNGDTLFDVNISKMIKQHKESITIAVSEMEYPDRYGVIQNGQLQEKVKAKKGLVSIGLYLINPNVLDLIPADGFCSLEHDIFPQLKQGFYQYNGNWFDMGTMDAYKEMR